MNNETNNTKNVNINLFGEKFGEYLGKEIDENNLGKETLKLGKLALILHFIKEYAVILLMVAMVVLVGIFLLTNVGAVEGALRTETKLGKSSYEIYHDGQWLPITKEEYYNRAHWDSQK